MGSAPWCRGTSAPCLSACLPINSTCTLPPPTPGRQQINQALALGVPVVTTPLGVEGMGLQEGSDVLVGTSPASFAAAVVAAYTDCERWGQLSQAGQRAAARRFGGQAARAALLGILRTVGAGAPPRSQLSCPVW